MQSPVVIASLKCKDMYQAIIKRPIEESKPGFDSSKPVYLCMTVDYARTAFKTVVASVMSNFYGLLRQRGWKTMGY